MATLHATAKYMKWWLLHRAGGASQAQRYIRTVFQLAGVGIPPPVKQNKVDSPDAKTSSLTL